MDPRVYIAAGVIAASAAGGWFINGWRKDAQIERLTAVHATLVDAGNRATIAAIRAEQDRFDKRSGEYAAIDTQRTKELNDANKELERIRTGVSNGSIGLRIAATCPARAPGVQTSTDPARVGDDTAPELTADARQNYLALRQGIIALTKQLEAAQDLLRVK